jgi:isopenicillin-N N-acyltransferase-like protein
VSLGVTHVGGAPRALGRGQGEAFAAAIHGALSFYRDLAESQEADLDAMAAEALRHLEAARGAVPQLVEELEGLVEGAGISLEEGLVLSCMEEVWPTESCTSLVHGNFLLHAEQWYASHSDIGVIIAKPDEGPAFASPTCVGFLPAVGISAAGFAQGIDSLSAHDERVGIPRLFVSRLAIGAPGLTAAVAAACSSGRAGGYAHVLATHDRRLVVETSACREAIIDDIGAHTNHYLSETLREVAGPASAGSRARLDRACELLRQAPPASLEDCARILSDHEGEPQTICLHEEGLDASGTVFGMACDVVTGRMIVSDGPPCAARWEEFAVPAFRGESTRSR